MTPEEQVEFYGADAAEWLRRWDEGRSVWSISMGGLGPSYEQAIQVAAAEFLRRMVSRKWKTKTWTTDKGWKRYSKLLDNFGFANPCIKELQLSGGQWGAAKNLASNIYMWGPVSMMTHKEVKDRHIQVRKVFPAVAS